MSFYFRDNKVEADHGRRSLRSGAVSVTARAVNAAIQIGSVLFLARLLSPEDYGLVSMVLAITGFAPVVVGFGTADAVIQRARLGEKEASALFWITMAQGCGLALLVAACGPLIAHLYGEPRLTAITLVSAVTFVASAVHCQHHALLRRAMRFSEVGVIEVTANVLSAGTAIAMAFYGYHYWALVVRPVTLNFLVAAGVWLRCRWLPGTPDVSSDVKDMLKLGLNSTGFTLTDFATRSTDKVGIGYRSGAAVLGYYQNALFVYENVIDVLMSPLHGVAVASLSKVREDVSELRRLWSKALSTLSFFAMPVFGLLAVTSQDLIVLVLGKKWTNAGILLSVLALRGIPHGVERTLGWLHVAAGRTDRWMRWGIAAMVAHLVALLCGLPFGPMGVVVAYVACMSILFIPAIAYAGQPFGIGAKDVITVIWRQLTGAVIAVGVGYLLRVTLFVDVPSLPRIAALATCYLAVYLAVTSWLLRLRMPLAVGMSLIQDHLPARFARLAGPKGFIDNHRYEHP